MLCSFVVNKVISAWRLLELCSMQMRARLTYSVKLASQRMQRAAAEAHGVTASQRFQCKVWPAHSSRVCDLNSVW